MCDRCCFSFQKALIYINGKDRQFYTHNLYSYMKISIVSHFLYIQLYDSPLFASVLSTTQSNCPFDGLIPIPKRGTGKVYLLKVSNAEYYSDISSIPNYK